MKIKNQEIQNIFSLIDFSLFLKNKISNTIIITIPITVFNMEKLGIGAILYGIKNMAMASGMVRRFQRTDINPTSSLSFEKLPMAFMRIQYINIPEMV